MKVLFQKRGILGAAAGLAMLLSVSACFDDSALKDSIDDLNGRVEALEDFRDQVQSEIDALQDIVAKLQSQVTVNSVEQNSDGSYTIRFSDGTSATISDGQDGMTPPTIIVILGEDGEYYWGYENPDGSEEFLLDDQGNKIKVTADAPQVRINPQTGNWEISTDGGNTWEDTGMPSEGTGDSLFLSVEEDDDYVYIELRNGEIITLPKTKELVFAIENDEQTLYFDRDESMKFDYTLSGHQTVTITKPDGWRAAIDGGKFVITAPAAGNEYAEFAGKVSVILTASNGQSFVAEQQVSLHPVSDIDLWKNTASFNAALAGSGADVFYKASDAAEWTEAVLSEGTVFALAPVWNKSANDAGLDVYSLEPGTGIFAGTAYQVEARVDGVTVMSYEFTTAEGDEIPNGDMSSWSMKPGNLPYPNAEGESFWDSGNNSMSAMLGNYLCIEDADMPGVAYLTANMVLNSVFAPGNMYVGDFSMDGVMGTASFGKPYDWTARPAALTVRFKSSVGLIDKTGANDPIGEDFKGKQDTSRIYAVVIDWTAQHGVTSGMGDPVGMWDPTTVTSLDEGAIIGYAMLDVTTTYDDFVTEEIPFVWYDTEGKPAKGNYSVVISCATSKRGDYLTGCSTNKLWVDSFEWTY